jgi:hypothetical protein
MRPLLVCSLGLFIHRGDALLFASPLVEIRILKIYATFLGDKIFFISELSLWVEIASLVHPC